MGLLEFFGYYPNKLTITGFFVFTAAFFLGIKFPDWDFKFKLRHRNILTHSPFVLLLLMLVPLKRSEVSFRYFMMGLGASIALHLIYDLFPKGWYGGAFLQTPFIKYKLSKKMSITVLIMSIISSLGIAIKYTKNVKEVALIAIYGLVAMFVYQKKESKLIRVLLIYISVLLVFSALKHKEIYNFLEMVFTNVEENINNTRINLLSFF